MMGVGLLMQCRLVKKRETENEVEYWFYPLIGKTGDVVTDDYGVILVNKKDKKWTISKKPDVDSGSRYSLYTGVAVAAIGEMVDTGNYPPRACGAW